MNMLMKETEEMSRWWAGLVKEKHQEEQMVVDYAKSMEMVVVNTYFQKKAENKVTLEWRQEYAGTVGYIV